MVRKLLFLMVAAAAVPARAVVVDDFSNAYVNSVQSGTWVDFQTGSMLTGERDVMFDVVSNAFNVFADLSIDGAGTAVFGNGFGVSTRFMLQYDGLNDEAANTGPGTSLINAGSGSPILTGFNDSVRVSFIGNDLDVKVTAVARLNGAVLESNSALRAAGGGAGNLDIALSSANLAAADSLTLVFEGAPSADFAISEVSTVPEPATIIALGAGLVALARRRRSR